MPARRPAAALLRRFYGGRRSRRGILQAIEDATNVDVDRRSGAGAFDDRAQHVERFEQHVDQRAVDCPAPVAQLADQVFRQMRDAVQFFQSRERARAFQRVQIAEDLVDRARGPLRAPRAPRGVRRAPRCARRTRRGRPRSCPRRAAVPSASRRGRPKFPRHARRARARGPARPLGQPCAFAQRPRPSEQRRFVDASA